MFVLNAVLSFPKSFVAIAFRWQVFKKRNKFKDFTKEKLIWEFSLFLLQHAYCIFLKELLVWQM